jgi:hypothetical protein
MCRAWKAWAGKAFDTPLVSFVSCLFLEGVLCLLGQARKHVYTSTYQVVKSDQH